MYVHTTRRCDATQSLRLIVHVPSRLGVKLPATCPTPSPRRPTTVGHRGLVREIIGANVPAEDSVIFSHDLWHQATSAAYECSRRAEQLHDFPVTCGSGKGTSCSTAVRTSCITSTFSTESVALPHHDLIHDAADPLLQKKRPGLPQFVPELRHWEHIDNALVWNELFHLNNFLERTGA